MTFRRNGLQLLGFVGTTLIEEAFADMIYLHVDFGSSRPSSIQSCLPIFHADGLDPVNILGSPKPAAIQVRTSPQSRLVTS
jgi:hypothetical protein